MSTEFLHLLKGLRLEMTEVCGARVVQRCQTPRGGFLFRSADIFPQVHDELSSRLRCAVEASRLGWSELRKVLALRVCSSPPQVFPRLFWGEISTRNLLRKTP